MDCLGLIERTRERETATIGFVYVWFMLHVDRLRCSRVSRSFSPASSGVFGKFRRGKPFTMGPGLIGLFDCMALMIDFYLLWPVRRGLLHHSEWDVLPDWCVSVSHGGSFRACFWKAVRRYVVATYFSGKETKMRKVFGRLPYAPNVGRKRRCVNWCVVRSFVKDRKIRVFL